MCEAARAVIYSAGRAPTVNGSAMSERAPSVKMRVRMIQVLRDSPDQTAGAAGRDRTSRLVRSSTVCTSPHHGVSWRECIDRNADADAKEVTCAALAA